MWYHFSQNNSGGGFTFDKKAGITHHVLIQAKSLDEANNRAEAIGLYFDGCDSGRDCQCCGDRWSRAYKSDCSEKPSVYSKPVTRGKVKAGHILWMKPNPEVVMHPLKGKFKWITGVAETW